jgi:hypothetical protein
MPGSTQPSPTGTPSGGNTAQAYITTHLYAANSVIQPQTAPNGYQYKTTAGGTTGGAAPVWPLVIGNSVTDSGGVIWVNIGTAPQGLGPFASPAPLTPTQAIGADAFTVAAVMQTVNNISDWVSFLLANALLPGTAQSGLFGALGGPYQSPPVTINRPNGVGTTHAYTYLWTLIAATGSALNQRCFLRDDGQLVLTTNCFPSPVSNLWKADDQTKPACAIYMGGRRSTGGNGFSIMVEPAPASSTPAGQWSDDSNLSDNPVATHGWQGEGYDFEWTALASTAAVTAFNGAILGGLGTSLTVTTSLNYKRQTGAGTSGSMNIAQGNYYGVGTTTGAFALTITDSVFGQVGNLIVIKDEAGTAATRNITITSNSAWHFDGAASIVMNVNFQTVRLINIGNAYAVI